MYADCLQYGNTKTPMKKKQILSVLTIIQKQQIENFISVWCAPSQSNTTTQIEMGKIDTIELQMHLEHTILL